MLYFFLVFTFFSSNGQIRLPSLIGSHMVLQQKSDAPIWGWAKPGEKIAVTSSWDQLTHEAMAGADGKWMVKVKTPAAGGPYVIEISGKKKVILDDILIGEVWLCSGQSNMEMPLRGWPEWGGPIDHSDAEIKAADYPMIRLFTVERSAVFQPQDDCKGSWSACSPETAKDFSATGYFFGRELYSSLNIPVGLIHSSWGGTPAEAWTSKDFITRNPEFTTSPGGLDAKYFLEKKVEQYYQDLGEWSRSIGFSSDQPVPGWATSSSTDGSWTDIPVPSNWDKTQIGDFTGVVEYRFTFTVPDGWIKKELVLELGPIDEMDITWINGKPVGSHLLVSDWATPRVYDIPAGTLKKGENILALRVANTSGIGGINGKPEKLKIRPKKSKTMWQPLAGIWKARKAGALNTGITPPVCVGCNEPNTPTMLYNGMIHPLIPFRIKGAIWYQGESNRYDGELYKRVFPGMITNWRHDWNQGDFPFYFVQIAPYRYQDTWSTGLLREAQDFTMRTVPNTGMVVTMDIGDLKNIHPGNKQDIGKRLASWALAKDYGKTDLVFSGPIFQSFAREGNKIRIWFHYAEEGLESDGMELRHFTIAGADHQFKPARAFIDGNTVVVYSDEVPDPLEVRFGWESTDVTNLFGAGGLTSGPFRTDTYDEYSASICSFRVCLKDKGRMRSSHDEMKIIEGTMSSKYFSYKLNHYLRMKNLFLFLLSAVLIWGCQKQPADLIRMTGTITNADTLVFKFMEGQKTDTISKAADGTFTFEKSSVKPVNGYLNVGKKYLQVYLSPGKDLSITTDYNTWDSTLVFGGSLKPVAEYMMERTRIVRAWSKEVMAKYMMEPSDYRITRDSLAGALNDLLAATEDVKGFDAGFAERQKLTILFEQVMDMKNYRYTHQYYAKKDTVILPDNWNDLEQGLSLNNPLLAEIPMAMNYLSVYISENAQKEAGLTGDVWGKPEFLSAKIAFIKKTFTSPEMVESFMFNNLGQQIDGNGTKGIDAQLAEYYGVAKNQDQVEEIKKKAAEWDAILPGQPAPDFTVVDMAGTEFTLSQFKGKYVFIDWWATWCGPCKVEIPHLKKLFEDYQKKNIVIMSISVDQDKKAWEKMVTEEGFAWLQLHDGTKENDKYVVKYIPSFILIDMEGKIIDPRAPNPSDPKLREVLEGLAGIQ